MEPMRASADHLLQPIATLARSDAPALAQDMTVDDALAAIREHGLGERIVYFYVVDERERLAGVLPTRRLLTAALAARLEDVMIRRVVAVPAAATVLEACEVFVTHRFLALPVVDDDRRLVGVVDATLLSDEVFDVAEREQANELFELLGFRLAQVRGASPLAAFRFRFPWLLATIASGAACALLVSVFAATLAQALVLAFFLTLVLALGESVSIQSMTVTIQSLHSGRPSLAWFVRALAREGGTALLLGLACGGVTAAIAAVWQGPGPAPVAIGLAIVGAVLTACVLGLAVPSLLHALRLDLKLAAGPLTLALADLATIAIYFTTASALL
jgi:magnesium transporter